MKAGGITAQAITMAGQAVGDASIASNPDTGASGGGGGAGMAGAIGGAVSATAQMVGSICSYVFGKRVMDAQYDLQKTHLDNQLKSAALTRDSQLATAETQMESVRIQEEGQALNNKALERRKKCEDAVIVEKAKKQQHELTKKATKGKFSKEAIRRIFNDPRASYAYGKTASRASAA